RRLPLLAGVIHAAGLLDDGVLAHLMPDRMAKVLGPKVRGAWHLHQLIRERPLDLFVLCSSASALLGSPGQSAYAAANAFLGALAHHRRALGLAALALDWGVWTEVGLAVAKGRGDRLAARGIEGLSPAENVEAFAAVLAETWASFHGGPSQRALMRLRPR